jgi:sterol desaturase/sphingolipid hydroxylase (fatty acid hydroxylase superfamily)
MPKVKKASNIVRYIFHSFIISCLFYFLVIIIFILKVLFNNLNFFAASKKKRKKKERKRKMQYWKILQKPKGIVMVIVPLSFGIEIMTIDPKMPRSKSSKLWNCCCSR